MVNLKGNKKTLVVILGTIAAVLASIVTIHQKSDYIINEMLYPPFKAMVKATVMEVAPEMVHRQVTQEKMSNNLSLGSQLTKEFDCSREDLPKVIKALADQVQRLDSLDKDKAALEKYIKFLTFLAFRGMEDTISHGYELKYDSYHDVFYTYYHGFMFEVEYRRSTHKYYFETSYGNRLPAPHTWRNR